MIRLFFILLLTGIIEARPYPIQFSIPESKIVSQIPEKTRDFAFIIPGDKSTYIYNTESDYYKGYQDSYFAITTKKGGWDCLRHYEILANGCIPYFPNLDQCHPRTMAFLPRELIKEAMNLPGVSYLRIDHNQFDKEKYYEILNKLLDHTRKHLTTRSMAHYVLQTLNYTGSGKILFLSNNQPVDYMRCLTLIGLKELLGERVVDYPKVEHIYKSYTGDPAGHWGRGFSVLQNVDDIYVDRSSIEQRIKNREFDLIIYGSVHRGLPFRSLVLENYPQEKIAYICGEDHHKCKFAKQNLHNLFLREFSSLRW